MTTDSRRLLVTGGSGFIGANFIRYALEHFPHDQIVNLDKLTYAGNPENLAGMEDNRHYQFVKGDICDREKVKELASHSDVIVHFAAESHVDRSIMDSTPFIVTNVMGTQVILDVIREIKNEEGRDIRLVHVSTDEVYGDLPIDRPELKFTEDTPYAPSSPYSASKASSDMLVRAYQHTYDLDCVITNCSNNFGPYQFPEKVIPLFVTNLIEGKKVPLYGDGRNVRDWLHVVDHCEAIMTVLLKGKKGETYCIGGNNEKSNLELTHAILAAMDKDESSIEYVQDRAGHDRRYAIDNSKIKLELGWQPSRSAWPQALEATVKWYVDNEQWWRNVRSGEYRNYYEKQYGG